jgi:parallel beta-helix repeat protein
MCNAFHGRLVAILAFTGLVAFSTVAGAETYRTCTGFIDSVPATIGQQGVWCLRGDLSTGIASGSAITVATNNVTIDCNKFKIGGLAAGDSSQAVGIHAYQRQNVVVRHCNVRGFYRGIHVEGGSGHLVEDNLLDNSLYTGIYVIGENSVVQRNRVLDTGGYPGNGTSFGIYTSLADVTGNLVSGVFADSTDTWPWGIFASGTGISVRGNTVRGLDVAGAGNANGIAATVRGRISDNHVFAVPAVTGYGIRALIDASACDGNLVAGFSTPIDSCIDAGGNSTL